MNATRSSWFANTFPRLLDRQDLGADAVREVITELVNGSADEVEAASWLTALRMKGESPTELAAAASVLRQHMRTLDACGQAVLDTCGTGGDNSGTFNISTAVAFVVAGAGVRVVKHGNRAVSSKSGSADVLAQLGVPITRGVEWAQSSLDQVGFAFCFAPDFHPAMANVIRIRRKLGVRTLFNLIGPLSNPAIAPFQLLGVGQADLLDTLAGALAILGVQEAILVHGTDGLDEVTLAGPTAVRWVRSGQIASKVWYPDDFGLEPVELAAIAADGPEASAQLIRDVLAGVDGPARRIVLANAAAALFAARQVSQLREGVRRAAESIDSGAAARILTALADSSR